MVGFFQLAALALFVQVLVNHKHLGHFVMVLYFVVNIVLPIAGLEHACTATAPTPATRTRT